MPFSFLYICLQLIQNYASSFSHIRFIIRRKRDTHYYEMTITLPFHCNIIFHPRHSSTLDVHQISPFCGGDFLGVMRYFRKLYAVFCTLAELTNMSASLTQFPCTLAKLSIIFASLTRFTRTLAKLTIISAS